MVSKLKKIFGGVFAVFVVLALIGACFGEDETAGGEATKSAANNIESRYESQKSDFIHKSSRKSDLTWDCKAGDNLACKKLEFVNKLIEKCNANDSKACAELALMVDKKQVWLVDVNNARNNFYMGSKDSGPYTPARRACELDNVDGCRLALKQGDNPKHFGEKPCFKFGNASDCLEAAKKASKYNDWGVIGSAITFLNKACELKSSEGCFTLGMLREGKRPSSDWGNYDHFGINYNTAKEYYDKACKLGNNNGCESAKRVKKERGL